MICTGNEYHVEHYADYRNRVIKKHMDKIKNQLRQINDCSLKGDDKKKLKEQMLKEIHNA